MEIGRDGCRVPLPWTAEGTSFGFGDGRRPPAAAGLVQRTTPSTAQDGAEGSTLELYRKALSCARELQTDEELEWVETGNPDVLHFARPNGWQSVTNFGAEPVALPEGEVVVSSGPLEDGKLPANTTAWIVPTKD